MTLKVPSVRYPKSGESFRFYIIARGDGEYTVTDLGDLYFKLEDMLPYSLHRSFETSTIRYDHATMRDLPAKVSELITTAEHLISVVKREHKEVPT